MFDSHAHLISRDQQRYRPQPLRGQLAPGEFDDPITAERLIELMDRAGVARACAVQRAHVYGYCNDYVLDSAERYPDRLGAVVVLDPLDGATPERLRELVEKRGAIGVRFGSPTFPDASAPWLSAPAVRDAWAAATALDVPVCVHVLSIQRGVVLPLLKALAASFPATRVVVDHVGGAHPAHVEVDWCRQAQRPVASGVDDAALELAALPQVYMKFSTINLGRLASLGLPGAPFLEHVVAHFGAERVMWGSDVAQTRTPYAQMVDWARAAAANLDPAAREAVLGDTASRVYGRRR